MQRRLVFGLLTLVLATAVGVVTVGGAVGPTGPADVSSSPPAQTTLDDFTSTVFEIRVYENSSARWTVRHSTPLNESQRSQFEEYADRFENQTTETYSDFQVRAQRLTAFGTNETGREMSAVDFSRRAGIEELSSRGVIEMSFRWTNFSQTTAEGIVIGDIFQGGMYLRPGQRLVIARGPNLRFVSVTPEPSSLATPDNLTASETVTWLGGENGTTFANERPRAVLSSADQSGSGTGGSAGTPGTDSTVTDTPPSDDQSAGGFGPLAFLVTLVVLVGVGGGIAWYSGLLAGLFDRLDDGAAGAEAETPTDESEATTQPSQPAVPEEELLSDDDRVLNLLEDNGGRMKQVNIVEETEWSKSKVSMLLSDMEDEGEISKLRVGRENIISLSGEEPDAVGSPFDDE